MVKDQRSKVKDGGRGVCVCVYCPRVCVCGGGEGGGVLGPPTCHCIPFIHSFIVYWVTIQPAPHTFLYRAELKVKGSKPQPCKFKECVKLVAVWVAMATKPSPTATHSQSASLLSDL